MSGEGRVPKSWRVAYAIASRMPTALGGTVGIYLALAAVTRRPTYLIVAVAILVIAAAMTVLVVEASEGRKQSPPCWRCGERPAAPDESGAHPPR